MMNIADREDFRVHLERTNAGLFISRPVEGRVSGRRWIQFSRPLTDEDDKLIGITVLSLDPDHLQQTFAMLNVGGGGAITLFREDGYVLVRAPALPGTRFDHGIDFSYFDAVPSILISTPFS